MRRPQKTKTPAVAGPGLPKKNESMCKSRVAFFRRHVNLLGLYFHFSPLTGLLACGFWCDRLVIWLPMADQAARLLRALMEARV